MKRVFVTGGTGFVGSAVVELLARRGFGVVVLARGTSRTDHLPEGVDVIRCDLLAPDTVSDVDPPDYFVHIAGLTKARRRSDLFEVNGEAVRLWLEWCGRRAPKLERFVLVSSLAAVRPSDKPIGEDTLPAPLSDYGKSKLLGERYANEFADRLPVTVIRPPAVYGPRDRDIFFYFRLASMGFVPVVGDPKRRFSIVYVEDLAEAVVLSMEHPSAVGETYFVTDGAVHTWGEFARVVSRAFGGRPIIRLPALALWGAAVLDEAWSLVAQRAPLLSFQKVRELLSPWVADSSKISRQLGFSPRFDLEAGVSKTVQWYREHGWIR